MRGNSSFLEWAAIGLRMARSIRTITSAAEAIERVGLAHRAAHRPDQLSGGEQQRVAIARAIVTDPYLLVADEPTGDLDRSSADEILALLEQLNREFEKTIVMVTHDPQAAKSASRLLHLDKGKLVDDIIQERPTRLGAAS